MLTVGVALTTAPVVALNAVFGSHVYVLPPLAVSVVVTPEQARVAVVPTVIVGSGFTVIVRVAVLLQPRLVPVTV